MEVDLKNDEIWNSIFRLLYSSSLASTSKIFWFIIHYEEA
jgi:hypothetical protein